MANPLDKIKKIKGKSWREIKSRGEQAIIARADRFGLSGNLPTDEEFVGLVDESFFFAGNVTPENTFEKFFEDAEYNFFPSFRQKEQTIEFFRAAYGENAEQNIVEKAERIIEGKFDLLGYENLDFGAEVNWHLEPLSGKIAPLKHWKQFDELSTDETGDKKIIWELNRHRHFFTLGAAFWLTGDERFAETFVSHLDGWMEANPPGSGVNWMSSLEVAFRVVSWIWAFNFFKDSPKFSPEIFWKAARFVYSHGRHIEKYLSTYYSPNTHLTGEALGLYYIGTQFSFLKSAKAWRDAGAKILFDELDRQILPDGVYFEQSTWYQRYTADFYTHFFILQTLNDGAELTEKQREKLAKKVQSLMDFLMAITRPDGTTPLIGDDDGGRLLPRVNSASDDFRAVLSNGAVLFERGDYKFIAKSFAEESLWLLGAAGARSFENLQEKMPAKQSFSFKCGGYFIMRDGWTETDNYLLIDCGELGALNGGHAHADALAINLAVGGKTVLVDSGTYSYHESVEIRNYFRSTEAHNTLTIDDQSSSATGNKFSWKTKANAELKRWISEDRFDFFEGTHDGYRSLPNSATHTREILFLKNDYWIVRDFVATSGRHDYKLNFHFDAAINAAVEMNGDDNFYATVASNSEGNLRLFTFGDNGNWAEKQSPFSNCYGRKNDATHLRFASEGTGAQEFFTFFLPAESGADAPQITEAEVAGGRAFVINFRGYQDLFVFADGDRIVHTEIFNTDFRFFWSRISAGETLPEEFVLIGGKNFSLDGREIINSAYDLEFLTARRFGNKLNMRTSESLFGISLPQKHPSAYILKNQR